MPPLDPLLPCRLRSRTAGTARSIRVRGFDEGHDVPQRPAHLGHGTLMIRRGAPTLTSAGRDVECVPRGLCQSDCDDSSGTGP